MLESSLLDNFKPCQPKPKDGEDNLLRRAFHHLLDSIIRLNASHCDDGYTLDIRDVDIDERKLLLSYLITPDDYAFYCQSDRRLSFVLRQYSKYMQSLVDDRIDQVYHDDMREMGMRLCHHADGDTFYVKR